MRGEKEVQLKTIENRSKRKKEKNRHNKVRSIEK
jgi:hypothetical protein